MGWGSMLPVAALLATVQAGGQAPPTPTPSPTQTPAPPRAGTAALPSDDIVVQGLRDLNDPGSAVTRETLGSGRVGPAPVESRRTFSVSMAFARCAMRKGGKELEHLRGTLDDTINSARQRFQQTRYVQLNATCAQDARIAQDLGIAAAVPTDYSAVVYNRGAMFVRAVQVFAPGYKLTAAMTGDPAVQRRFDAREVPLARFRLQADLAFFQTAVCFVRMQPELSTRLVHAEAYEDITRIESMIVNGSKPCVGNAKQVFFDPVQLRFYVADAVYRWMVAAQGTTTLIAAKN